jgi:hypothetical protein
MIFTVFQYVPILEEESPSHKTEMAKKAKQGDLADGDGNDADADDDCNDNDSEQDLNYSGSAFYTALFSAQSVRFSNRNNFYTYLLDSKDTPPPKI